MNKGLEELERLAYENACCRCQYWGEKGCSLWSRNIYSCVWLEIKKELKALEIIKEKRVDVDYLMNRLPCDCFRNPNGRIEYNNSTSMTQKDLGSGEYDLLKEVLLK